jgi:hypothetical protein
MFKRLEFLGMDIVLVFSLRKIMYMKPFLVLVAFILIVGCKKNDYKTIKNETKISAEVLDYLTCQKFSLSNAQLMDGNLILEDDIILDYEIIKGVIAGNLPKTEQYAINASGVLTWVNSSTINYFIDPSVDNMPQGQDWINAIVTASQDWTNIQNSWRQFDSITCLFSRAPSKYFRQSKISRQ